MSLKRLFPTRWARILTWTGAALAWGTTAVAVAATSQEATLSAGDMPADPSASTPAPSATATMPDLPDGGLVILRYTPSQTTPTPQPAAAPAVSSGAAGNSGSTGGGNSSPAATRAPDPPPRPPAPTTTIASEGS
jgi:hypothetical protein